MFLCFLGKHSPSALSRTSVLHTLLSPTGKVLLPSPMGRFQHFLGMVDKSKFLAPNLKEMTLRFYTGNKHGGNAVARDLVLKHLLALRWMNPNAVIYLREFKGQGSPEIDYELCKYFAGFIFERPDSMR